MFGTLQGRLPQELRLAGITHMEAANRFLKNVFLPAHNARFAIVPDEGGTAFVPFAGDLRDILCVHEDRVVGNDNTVALSQPGAANSTGSPPPSLRQGARPGPRIP